MTLAILANFINSTMAKPQKCEEFHKLTHVFVIILEREKFELLRTILNFWSDGSKCVVGLEAKVSFSESNLK